jgi:hypothetical protein
MLPQEKIDPPPSFNFREVDWVDFNKKLKVKISVAPNPQHINNQEQLDAAVKSLTAAIQDTIKEVVTTTKPRPDEKRWWNGDLARTRKELNRLRVSLYKNRVLADHPSHKELRIKSNQYGEQIIQAKRQHWTDYLEEMTAADIWSANKFIREPVGDGGSPLSRSKGPTALKCRLTTTRKRPEYLPNSFSR